MSDYYLLLTTSTYLLLTCYLLLTTTHYHYYLLTCFLLLLHIYLLLLLLLTYLCHESRAERLGGFATVLEAAVCFAKAWAAAGRPPAEQHPARTASASAMAATAAAARETSTAAARAGSMETTRAAAVRRALPIEPLQPTPVVRPSHLPPKASSGDSPVAKELSQSLVTEADGWQLHLSASSNTGYKGVCFVLHCSNKPYYYYYLLRTYLLLLLTVYTKACASFLKKSTSPSTCTYATETGLLLTYLQLLLMYYLHITCLLLTATTYLLLTCLCQKSRTT